MTERYLPPFLQVEEGAPPGTLDAFAGLTAIILEQPEEASAVFASLGNTAEAIQQAAAEEPKPTAQEAYRLRLAQACGALLREEIDYEVDMGQEIDTEIRRAANERGMDRHQLRIRRLGAFVKHASIWGNTLPDRASTLKAA